MAVYKKDGSVYKLNGPNALMISQEKWGTFVTHNLGNLSNLKMESNIPHVVLGEKKEPEQKKEIIQIKEELKEEPKVEIIIEEKIEIKEETKFIQPVKNEFEGFSRTIMHCALAKREEKKDSLYDETTIRIKYVDSFTFEAIVLSTNDFTLIFWTKLEKLTIGSVLYPQNDSKRWWEIKEIESVPGGYKVVCVITKNTPAF